MKWDNEAWHSWISHGYIKQKSDDRHGIDCLILILLLIVLSSVIENWILA